MIVENGESVKIHVSFIVPEAHKFDPVAVEFGFAFEKVGNEDRNFLLQGTTDLVLTFVNKGTKVYLRVITLKLEPHVFIDYSFWQGTLLKDRLLSVIVIGKIK